MLKRLPEFSALKPHGVAFDRANEPATAFEESDWCGPGPNDLRFNREPADLGMIERNYRAAESKFVVVRKADARERQILADDGRFIIDQQIPIRVDGREAKRVRYWEAVPCAPLVVRRGRPCVVDQHLNLLRKRIARYRIIGGVQWRDVYGIRTHVSPQTSLIPADQRNDRGAA
jgi:hypothetical protein